MATSLSKKEHHFLQNVLAKEHSVATQKIWQCSDDCENMYNKNALLGPFYRIAYPW